MTTYLVAMGIILVILLAWVAVQQAARLFFHRHPEFGSYREKVGCCGNHGSHDCGGDSCSNSSADDT
ncbi:MAG: hypothetical protein LJE70_03570 [Chromatiaceae bacterium]|jgi:hypothetical protein|nr:hypothetical protein [Chromatiaceae bacterium]